MGIKISVTILVKNAQKTIKECLLKLQEFDEVILLDNLSEDQTIEIAKSFENVKIFQSEFIGFGALKNLAISYTTNDWILSLDSDEILEDKLLEEIKKLKLEQGKYYSFLRKNLYAGEWVRGCGWHPDWVKRIFNKNEIAFDDALVHEGLKIPKECMEVKIRSGGILHYSFENISDLLDKLQRYSSLWAKQNAYKQSSPLKAILRGVWTFIRNYLIKRGFLYGYKGFIISVCNALGAFFKYMKLYENSLKSLNVTLIITTYNQKERLALVLDSVLAQKQMPAEVLIADDGSTEDTRELVKMYQQKFPISLRHIWQEDQGYRLAKSRNEAIKEAKGEYIIIVDGDMILYPMFIADHLRFAKKRTFVQGGRILLSDQESSEILKSNNFSLAFLKKTYKSQKRIWLSNLIFLFSKVDKRVINKEKILSVRGCNMAFYKEDAVAINGFNEDFMGWGREDSEFVVRFLNNGGVMRKLKFAGIAYHLHHQENSREMLESNHQIYLDTLNSKSTYCRNGLR